MKLLKPYRATETALKLDCEMAWWLRKQGWVQAMIGAKEAASCLGTAFHAGAEHLLVHPTEHDRAQELAREALVKTAGAYYNSGRVIKPATKADMEALDRRVINAVKALHRDIHMVHDEFDVLGVELALPRVAGTRIDAVLRHRRQGHVVILDWKCKTFDKPWYKEQFIAEFGQSWQLKEYCWGYEHETGEPVEWFLLGLMDVTTSARLELWPYHLDAEDKSNWLKSATQAWEDMLAIEEGRRYPAQSHKCRNQYGLCDYYNACWVHQYGESMEGEYTHE